MSSVQRKRRSLEIWPAFVDATASLLMVVIFVLLIAIVGQLLMSTALSGRDQALSQLNARVAELAEQLSMQNTENLRLGEVLAIRTASLETALRSLSKSTALNVERAEIIDEIGDTVSAQDRLLEQKEETLSKLENEVTTLTSLRNKISDDMEKTIAERNEIYDQLRREADINLAAKAQMDFLNRQLAELTRQLSELNRVLEVAGQDSDLKQATIDDLGRRLNVALAHKAQQLAQYRSAFFGRLRAALSDYSGIEIVGDRFVLPSSILFATGSDQLADDGREQVTQLATTLQEIARLIPQDIDWILRIDGHTDKRPLKSSSFRSNWELSVARAITIVRALSVHGIPERRLAATGFAEHHPIDPGENLIAYARNRRIEIKLTSR